MMLCLIYEINIVICHFLLEEDLKGLEYGLKLVNKQILCTDQRVVVGSMS